MYVFYSSKYRFLSIPDDQDDGDSCGGLYNMLATHKHPKCKLIMFYCFAFFYVNESVC